VKYNLSVFVALLLGICFFTVPSSFAAETPDRDQAIFDALTSAAYAAEAPADEAQPADPTVIPAAVEAVSELAVEPPAVAAEPEAGPVKKLSVAVDAQGNVSSAGKSAAADITVPAAKTAPESGATDLPAQSDFQQTEMELEKRIAQRERQDSVWTLIDRENPMRKLEIGPELFFYSYKEPNLMKLTGSMAGAYATYDYRWKENRQVNSIIDVFNADNAPNLFRLDMRGAYGKLDYKSNGTGEDSGEPNYVFEIRGVFGYDIPFKDVYQLTPYFGGGYRYLKDDSGGRITTTGHWGYDRESEYAYLPAGFDLTRKFKNSWSCRLNVEGDIFISGRQTSHLEDVSSGYSKVKNDQDSGYGMRGGFRVMKESKAFDLFLEPFVRYWHIKDSNASAVTYSGAVVGYGIEPENNTWEWGIKAGLRY